MITVYVETVASSVSSYASYTFVFMWWHLLSFWPAHCKCCTPLLLSNDRYMYEVYGKLGFKLRIVHHCFYLKTSLYILPLWPAHCQVIYCTPLLSSNDYYILSLRQFQATHCTQLFLPNYHYIYCLCGKLSFRLHNVHHCFYQTTTIYIVSVAFPVSSYMYHRPLLVREIMAQTQ